VHLESTTGDVVLLGDLLPSGQYELVSFAGQVRLEAPRERAIFHLRARSPSGVDTTWPLRQARKRGDLLEAAFGGPRRGEEPAMVILTSARGRVQIGPVEARDVSDLPR